MTAIHATAGEPFDVKLKVDGREMKVKLAGHELWGKHIAARGAKGAFLPKKGILQA